MKARYGRHFPPHRFIYERNIMKWQIDSDRPVYKQLIEQTEQAIVSGIFSPGERLPSVRDLAAEAGVNPNTMQRALAELERSGILYSQRTSGRFITDDEEMIDKLRYQKAEEDARTFFDNMKKLGLSADEIARLLRAIFEEDKDEKSASNE